MIDRRASSVRLAWLGALVLCAMAPFVRAAPVKDAAPREAPADPQRLQRVDALIEASHFPKIYDATMVAAAEGAPDTPRARLLVETMRLVLWARAGDAWRSLMARAIPDDVLVRAEAFYASDAGRALSACVAGAEGQAAIRACASIPELGDADVSEYVTGDFLRPQTDEEAIAGVFSGVFCRTLAEDPSLIERIAAYCETAPAAGVCTALVRSESGVTLDRERCRFSL